LFVVACRPAHVHRPTLPLPSLVDCCLFSCHRCRRPALPRCRCQCPALPSCAATALRCHAATLPLPTPCAAELRCRRPALPRCRCQRPALSSCAAAALRRHRCRCHALCYRAALPRRHHCAPPLRCRYQRRFSLRENQTTMRRSQVS
jgi:hypothetical protein